MVGHNTDILGFDKAIKNLNFDMRGKKIFILGAGGVVPSIIFALNKMNVSKIIPTLQLFFVSFVLRRQIKDKLLLALSFIFMRKNKLYQ